MADVELGRWLRHPPETVWRALSEPSIARRWLPFEGYRPEVGHSFVADGPGGPATCEVLVVEPPSRIEILWQVELRDTRVCITLRPEGGGTWLQIEHRDLPEHCYSPFLTAWSVHSGSLATALVPMSTYATFGLAIAIGTVLLASVGLAVLRDPDATDPPSTVPASEGLRAETATTDTKSRPHVHERAFAEGPTEAIADAGPDPVELPDLPPLTWDGEQLQVVELALPTTLHPLYPQTEVDRRIQTLLFDRLFHRSAITGDLRSRVLEHSTWSAQPPELRLALRDDVRFHDGTPLTATDVCFSVQAALDPSSTVSIRDRGVLGCTVTDPRHASIRFDAVYAEPRARVAQTPLLPAHLFRGPPRPSDAFATQPVGSGPYRGRIGRRGVRLVPSGSPHHPVQLGALSFETPLDPYVQVKLLESGAVQGIISIEPQNLGPIRASDDRAVKTFDPHTALYLAVSPRLPLPLRQAIDAALERRALHETTYGRDPLYPHTPFTGPWLPGSPHYNRRIAPPRTGSEAVEVAMLALGAELRHGRWHLNGEPIVLRFGLETPQRRLPIVLRDQLPNALRSVGFQVERVERPEQADLWLRRKHWGTFEQADDLLAGGPFPEASPEITALLAAMHTARTDTERQDAGHALHTRMAAEKRVLPLWPEVLKSGWTVEVRGNTIAPDTYWDEVGSWRSR